MSKKKNETAATRILTVTANPSIDTTATVDLVIAEAKLRCASPSHLPGGGGINVSRAIRELGGSSTAIYPAGGYYGGLLKHLLDVEGLSHLPLDIEDLTREDLIVLEKSTGRQFRFGMPGPLMKETDIKRMLEAIRSISPKPHYVVASGSLPPGAPQDFYARVADVSREIGARLIVDTSGRPLQIAARSDLFILKPNLRELAQIIGHDIRDETEIRPAARSVLETGGSEAVVVSLGPVGALLVTKSESLFVRAPAVRVVSRVGAGDSLVAGIVFSLSQGASLEDSVRYGVASSSAAVMSPDIQLCRHRDVERLYKVIRTDPTQGDPPSRTVTGGELL